MVLQFKKQKQWYNVIKDAFRMWQRPSLDRGHGEVARPSSLTSARERTDCQSDRQQSWPREHTGEKLKKCGQQVPEWEAGMSGDRKPWWDAQEIQRQVEQTGGGVAKGAQIQQSV